MKHFTEIEVDSNLIEPEPHKDLVHRFESIRTFRPVIVRGRSVTSNFEELITILHLVVALSGVITGWCDM